MGKSFIDRIVNTIVEEVVKRLSSQKDASFFIRDRGQYHRVKYSEIISISAERALSIIRTKNKEHLISASLGFLEKQISNAKNLKRVHRSYIINIDKIERINYADREIYMEVDSKDSKEKAHRVPFSNTYADDLLKNLKIIKTR